MCGGCQRQRHRGLGLRETVGNETTGHTDYSFEDWASRYACLPSIRRSQCRCSHTSRQSTIRSAITSSDCRGSRHHRIYHQIRCWCTATVYTERGCKTVRNQYIDRGIRQRGQGASTIPDGAVRYLFCMVCPPASSYFRQCWQAKSKAGKRMPSGGPARLFVSF